MLGWRTSSPVRQAHFLQASQRVSRFQVRVPLQLALVPDSEPKGTVNCMILVWLWIRCRSATLVSAACEATEQGAR